jgi:hypothetical protein
VVDWTKPDPIEDFQKLFENRGLHIRDDGKIEPNMGRTWNSPWVHIRIAGNRDCFLWKDVMFPAYNFVPSGCQSCWKTVVRPSTLEQLMGLYEIQKKLDLPSKCGIELREYVHGLYGGYFYADSLEEGREQYRIVREAVPAEIPVILKRACTEYEMKIGPSNKWEVTEYQKKIERYISDIFVSDVKRIPQPEFLVENVMKKWVRWAYAHGDPTYKLYTGAMKLYPDYVTYHLDS